MTTIFNDVKAFLLFIGYPRSGHTLIGSLLDAHPHMVVANEYNALRQIKQYDGDNVREHILSNIYQNTKRYQGQRINPGYNYTVPNAYQGTYRDTISIIGDKKGGATTQAFVRDYEGTYQLVKAFQTEIGLPIKCLHVLRNPFDNIATMSLRSHSQMQQIEYSTRSLSARAPIELNTSILDEKMTRHFARICTNDRLVKSDLWEVHQIYTEDFLADPISELKKILHFLDMKVDEEYLSCTDMVRREPSRSSRLIAWPEKYIEAISAQIDQYEFLRRYRSILPLDNRSIEN